MVKRDMPSMIKTVFRKSKFRRFLFANIFKFNMLEAKDMRR